MLSIYVTRACIGENNDFREILGIVAMGLRRTDKSNMPRKETKKKITPKKVALMLLLAAANLFVANVVYNCWTAKRGTPLMESVKANMVSKLWMSRPRPAAKPGMVSGIICDDSNPGAIIDGEVINEGDVINNAQVIKISKTDVLFEKDGRKWTQEVGQSPNPAWK